MTADISTDTIIFDDETIRRVMDGGAVETIRWDDLSAIMIETTDAGPFADDVFWILVAEDLQSGCVIASEAVGAEALIERLMTLPDFNYETMIQAMASTDNAKFLVWEKEPV